MSCTTPGGYAGSVELTVRSEFGEDGRPAAFEYVDPADAAPSIDSISPARGIAGSYVK